MTIWYLFDPHFGSGTEPSLHVPRDENISALEISELIIHNISSRIRKGDMLVIGGDFSFREAPYWRNMIAKSCHCDCQLVLGNHDKPGECRKVFGSKNVRTTWDTKCCGQPMFLSHYPHFYWPKSHYGSFHGYGHVHDQRTSTIEQAFPEIRSMDLGVGAAKRVLGDYTCFKDQEVYDILISRKGHDDVEFYEKNYGRYQKGAKPID